MRLLVVICSNGDTRAMDACVAQCRMQSDAVESDGRYSVEITTPSSGQDLLSAWDNDPSSVPELCLWLSRPLDLKEGVLAALLENSEFLRHKALIVASVSDKEGNVLSGGRTRRGRLIQPDPVIPVPCRFYDTEMFFVPGYVIRRLGSSSDLFKKTFYEYAAGSKVIRAEVSRVVAPGVLASVEALPVVSVWNDSSSSFPAKSLALLKEAGSSLIRVIHSLHG